MSQGILGPKLTNLVSVIMREDPRTYVEIGTYRLHTFQVVNLLMDDDTTMIGFDFFEDAPELEEAPVDAPPATFEEACEIVKGFKKHVRLFQGDTKETLKYLKDEVVEGPVVVFVDGGHSKETLVDNINQLYEYLKGYKTTVVIDDLGMPGVDDGVEEISQKWPVEYRPPYTGVIRWDKGSDSSVIKGFYPGEKYLG